MSRDYDDDFGHRGKINFKQYLQDDEDDSLLEDRDILPVSQIKFDSINLLVILEFGYNGNDGDLEITIEALDDLLDLDDGSNLELPYTKLNENFYVQRESDMLIFDSGITGKYGKVVIEDLLKLKP